MFSELQTPAQCSVTSRPKQAYSNASLNVTQMPGILLHHLFLFACSCLHAASPLKADRLSPRPLQPLRPDWSSTRVSAISSPLSRSSSVLPGIGIAAEGDSFVDSAAMTCTSSPSCSSWYGGCEGDGAADDECARERTTSFLHIGHVRRRVVSQGVMQSAWNSWPHGRLITWLCPSTYSSRQTTHSTCFPLYLRFDAERLLGFSCLISSSGIGLWKDVESSSPTPDMVLERGLERGPTGRGLVCRSGEVGEDVSGEATRIEEVVEEADMVW